MAQMFLKLAGISGEAQDHKHTNDIEIVDFGWEVAHKITRRGKDEEEIAPTFADITITKGCDAASKNLMQFLTSQEKIPSGELTFRKHEGEWELKYLVIKLTNIRVTSFKWTSALDGELSEVVSFSVDEFHAEYRRQGEFGYPVGVIEFGFNLERVEETSGSSEERADRKNPERDLPLSKLSDKDEDYLAY